MSAGLVYTTNMIIIIRNHFGSRSRKKRWKKNPSMTITGAVSTTTSWLRKSAGRRIWWKVQDCYPAATRHGFQTRSAACEDSFGTNGTRIAASPKRSTRGWTLWCCINTCGGKERGVSTSRPRESDEKVSRSTVVVCRRQCRKAEQCFSTACCSSRQERIYSKQQWVSIDAVQLAAAVAESAPIASSSWARLTKKRWRLGPSSSDENQTDIPWRFEYFACLQVTGQEPHKLKLNWKTVIEIEFVTKQSACVRCIELMSRSNWS